MSQLFRIFPGEQNEAVRMQRSSMAEQKFKEVQDLERWVVENPEILGDDVLVVTQQFNQFVAKGGASAAEKPDILGLDSTGQLVVVELKLAKDKKIHLQAITYAALVANFTRESLGAAHAAYLGKGGPTVSPQEAFRRLEDHVEGDWDEDILATPRIMLVAEEFPSQVLTTAQWLANVSGGGVQIECVAYDVFHDGSVPGDLDSHPSEPPLVCLSFRRIWPPDDMQDQILGPVVSQQAQSTQKKIADKTQTVHTAKIIADNELIPLGSRVKLLTGVVSQELRQHVEAWLREDESRNVFTWSENSNKPLRWGLMPGVQHSLTGLAKAVIEKATGEKQQSLPGGNAWSFQGQSMYELAHGSSWSGKSASDDVSSE